METATGADRKLAVVTGGNKGIGYYCAQQLVAAGLRVIIACRSEELARKAAAELGAEYELVDLSSEESIAAFVRVMTEKHGRLDVLVNNAGFAFKESDPTPFKDMTAPTLRINLYGTISLTDQLLPLLRASAAAGRQPRIVNVASLTGHLKQLREDLQQQFSSPTLERPGLMSLVQKYVDDVQADKHTAEGWGNSNYGFSKLALIAYTKIVAREEGDSMRVNSCCPGYCDTDMTSHKGPRSPEVGAGYVSQLALLPDSAPTGAFWEDGKESVW